MWHIENPFKVFKYAYQFDNNKSFNFVAIINVDKYQSFPEEDRKLIEQESGITIKNVEIKNPNNPATLKKAVVITFSR